jgi:hypothetical protein
MLIEVTVALKTLSGILEFYGDRRRDPAYIRRVALSSSLVTATTRPYGLTSFTRPFNNDWNTHDGLDMESMDHSCRGANGILFVSVRQTSYLNDEISERLRIGFPFLQCVINNECHPQNSFIFKRLPNQLQTNGTASKPLGSV